MHEKGLGIDPDESDSLNPNPESLLPVRESRCHGCQMAEAVEANPLIASFS
jgi:hypothetical protein